MPWPVRRRWRSVALPACTLSAHSRPCQRQRYTRLRRPRPTSSRSLAPSNAEPAKRCASSAKSAAALTQHDPLVREPAARHGNDGANREPGRVVFVLQPLPRYALQRSPGEAERPHCLPLAVAQCVPVTIIHDLPARDAAELPQDANACFRVDVEHEADRHHAIDAVSLKRQTLCVSLDVAEDAGAGCRAGADRLPRHFKGEIAGDDFLAARCQPTGETPGATRQIEDAP